MAKKHALAIAAVLILFSILLIFFLRNQEKTSDKLGTLKPPAVQRIFLLKDSQKIETVAVPRQINAASDTLTLAQEAVKSLISGPSSNEKSEDLFTALPPSKLLGIKYSRPYIYLNFDDSMANIGGTMRIDGILRQLTNTLSSIRGIKGVILQVNGKQVGTLDNPYTGDGFLFRALYPKADNEVVSDFSPADALDLFIASIPDREAMWSLMGPKARKDYGSASKIEISAFAEGLGAWRDYQVIKEQIEGNKAQVIITGTQKLEGQIEKDARYTASMIKENGIWKWEKAN